MHLDMITVGGYFPAAGRNTIRKVSEKYQSLKIGDTVTMIYCESVGDDGGPVDVIATEALVVSSVAMAGFARITSQHLEDNHAVLNRNDEGNVLDHLFDLYDSPDNETPFMAIYFA